MPPPLVVRVPVDELRKHFNERYLQKTLSGYYLTRNFGRQALHQSAPAENGRVKEPAGTTSGLVEIIDPESGQRLAVAHRLLRPDGTLGASGLPDPKMVMIDGVVYLQQRKQGRVPADLRTPSLFSDPSDVG